MSRIRSWPRIGVLVIGAIVFLFPFYYMVVGSIQATPDTSIAGAIPIHGVTLHNYGQINERVDLLRSLTNSGIFTGGVLLFTVVFGVLAGYALARLHFRGRGGLFGPVLLTATLIAFIGPWNEFLWPFLVTKDANLQPLAVSLANYISNIAGRAANPYGAILAGDVADVVRERDRKWLQVGILGDQERPEELVPRPDEGDEGGREQRGADQREPDRPEDSQLAGTVDAGRREEILRKREEELPEDEHRGGVDGERQDHAHVGVGEPIVAHDHHVERDDQELEGNDLHEQHEPKEAAPPAEVQTGEGVAGQHPEHDGEQEHPAGEDAGVGQRTQ